MAYVHSKMPSTSTYLLLWIIVLQWTDWVYIKRLTLGNGASYNVQYKYSGTSYIGTLNPNISNIIIDNTYCWDWTILDC